MGGCTSQKSTEQETIQEVGRISLMDVVPDTLLANVTDYLITSSGAIYIADARLQHIVILDEDRNFLRVVGRSGQGPGEFQWPYRLALVSDTLMVWDRMNGRLEYFTSDGNFLHMARPDPFIDPTSLVRVSDDGRLLVSTFGIGAEYLVRVYNMQLSGFSPLGTLEVPSTSVMLMGLSRSDARSKKIPDGLKNRAFAIHASDGGMILIHFTIPIYKKYDSSGRELWRFEQDLPQLKTIREDVFDKALQETSGRAYGINYWRGGVSDGKGGCYLQLSSLDKITLFHLKADGTLGEPIEGPEGNWRTLRRYNGYLWFLNGDTLELMQIQVGS